MPARWRAPACLPRRAPGGGVPLHVPCPRGCRPGTFAARPPSVRGEGARAHKTASTSRQAQRLSTTRLHTRRRPAAAHPGTACRRGGRLLGARHPHHPARLLCHGMPRSAPTAGPRGPRAPLLQRRPQETTHTPAPSSTHAWHEAIEIAAAAAAPGCAFALASLPSPAIRRTPRLTQRIAAPAVSLCSGSAARADLRGPHSCRGRGRAPARAGSHR